MSNWPLAVLPYLQRLRNKRHTSLTVGQRILLAALLRADKRAAEYAFRFLLPHVGSAQLPAAAKNPVVLLLKPTGDSCNMACDYCYEALRQRESGKIDIMSIEEMRRCVANALAAPSQIREIYLHGGEPLLAGKDFFRAFVKAVRSARNGSAICIGVQTNGVLIDAEWIDIFRDGEMKIGVSLDGDSAINGMHRLNLGGRPTYQHVRQAIDMLHECGIEFGVIGVFSKEIALIQNAPEKILDHMHELHVTHFDIHPAFTPPETSGLASLHNVSPIQFSCFMTSLFDAWLNKERGGIVIRSFEDIFQQLSGVKSNVCYKSGQCVSIVGANQDGKIVPCTRPFDDKYFFGNILSTPIKGISSNMVFAEFEQAEMRGQEATAACEWRDFCGNGGCPHERFLEGKQSPAGKHIYCTCHGEGTGGYPALFEHVLAVICRLAEDEPTAAERMHVNTETRVAPDKLNS